MRASYQKEKGESTYNIMYVPYIFFGRGYETDRAVVKGRRISPQRLVQARWIKRWLLPIQERSLESARGRLASDCISRWKAGGWSS